MADAHSSQQPKCRRWNRHGTPALPPKTTPALEAPPDVTEMLWSKLLLKLAEEQLDLEDLPATEEPLWGTLYELGFTSYVEQGRFCKKISATKSTRFAKHPTNGLTHTTPADSITVNTDGLLSRPGKRGLDVACRSAHEMATSVCQNTHDTTLWLQMPHTVTNIGANIKAYEIMQAIRKKHPDSSNKAQRASIALRDALAVLIVNNYETFDEALLHIASITNLSTEAMRLLQSQVHLSRVSMTSLVQQTTGIEDKIHKIF